MRFVRKPPLRAYEIRLTKMDHKAVSIYQTTQADDRAAIRCALALAAEESGVEVWRGMVCVYADSDCDPSFAA